MRDSSDSLTLRSNPEYEWMMYHFMLGLRGASAVVAAAPSAEACAAAGSPAAVSFFSSSTIFMSSVRLEIVEHRGHAVLNGVVDHREIEGKNEYGDYDHRSRRTYFLERRRRDLAHLGADVVVKTLDPVRPGFDLVAEIAAHRRHGIRHFLRLDCHTF